MPKRTPQLKEREALALTLQPDPPSLREMKRLMKLNKETCWKILIRNQALLDELRRANAPRVVQGPRHEDELMTARNHGRSGTVSHAPERMAQ